jgi:hypothetical protein
MNTIIDVPFIKYFIYPYNIWYPFVILSSFLIYKYNNIKFKPFIISMILVSILAEITFFIYPTEVIRPEVTVNDFTTWLIDFTYKSDTPAVHCLPSVHCLFTFISTYYVLISKNIKSYKKITLSIVAILIVLSTIFIKQHIVEDIFLALIYATIVLLTMEKMDNSPNIKR